MTKSISVDAAIVVPWRAAEGREQSFDLAWRYNNKEFADFKVYFSDSVGERFNVSEARNRGCIQAIEDGYKTLVIIDADTIFTLDSVLKAVEEVNTKYVISYTYTYAFETNQKISHLLDIGATSLDELAKDSGISEGHVGSGWAMTSEMFWEINGWDENFYGWGWEDTAFQKAYELLFSSEMSRAPGTCYRLWHPERDSSHLDSNRLRYEGLYNNPDNNVEAMRSVLRGNMVHRSVNEVG
jgi:hypothetical protein